MLDDAIAIFEHRSEIYFDSAVKSVHKGNANLGADFSKEARINKKVVEWLRELKQLREQTRWIPVSERLPKEDGKYLVTVKNLTGYEQLCNDVFECEFFGKDWIFKGWKDNKVIAWMPLPTPYQPKDGEKE